MRGAILALAAWFGLWTPPPAAVTADVRFEGNQSFASGQLLAILRNRYYVPLTGNFGVTEADDAAYFLRAFYFSRGFREASVTYTYQGSTPPAVAFDITEGGANFIESVTFEGESAIPPARLSEIFNATVRQATLRPFGRMRYVDSAVEAGRVSIVNALAQQGYLMATADISEPVAAANGLVNLRVRLYQGVRYSVQDVRFTGLPPASDHQPPITAETLRGVLREYLDRPYQRNQEALMRTRVEDWLRNRGYLQAAVATTATLDPDTGAVDVAFDLAAGRIFTIGTIRVEGSTATRPAAILARLGLEPGALYDASKVDEAARRLWFSGAFAEADVQRIPKPESETQNPTSEAGTPATVDLVVKVQETSAKRIQFGLGYSQWDGGFGEIHYIDRNFLGTLNRFSIDGTLSQRTYSLSSTLTDPWLFGTNLEGSVGISYARRELPAYRNNEAAGTLTLAHNINAKTLTGYRLQYGYKAVSDAVIFGDSADNVDPDYTLGSVTFSQTYDTRNNILSPMKGLYLNHEEELASPLLLGDVAFLRLSVQATYYLPLREITTEHPFVPFLIFNHRAGILLPYAGNTTVPVQERFFLGGPNTVRSFQLDGLGPQDKDGDPLGGLGMILLNAEIQWPVLNNIYLAAFADAGNIWTTVRDIQPAALQLGVGPGLRLYTPLGAIRVDYGYNVNRRPGDPVGAWQFGFGFTF